MNFYCDSAWDKVSATKGPHEMSDLIDAQRKACKEMIMVKETLLNEYAVELKSKDDDYVKELKRQAEEIGTLKKLILIISLNEQIW